MCATMWRTDSSVREIKLACREKSDYKGGREGILAVLKFLVLFFGGLPVLLQFGHLMTSWSPGVSNYFFVSLTHLNLLSVN